MGCRMLTCIAGSTHWGHVELDSFVHQPQCHLCGDTTDWVGDCWGHLLLRCTRSIQLQTNHPLAWVRPVCKDLGIPLSIFGCGSHIATFVWNCANQPPAPTDSDVIDIIGTHPQDDTSNQSDMDSEDWLCTDSDLEDNPEQIW